MSKTINYNEEPNTRTCWYCNVEFDLDIEEHFHSTDDNYMHRRCGDKLLDFKENWWDKGFNYHNAFDMWQDGEVDEFWKLEERYNE